MRSESPGLGPLVTAAVGLGSAALRVCVEAGDRGASLERVAVPGADVDPVRSDTSDLTGMTAVTETVDAAVDLLGRIDAVDEVALNLAAPASQPSPGMLCRRCSRRRWTRG